MRSKYRKTVAYSTGRAVRPSGSREGGGVGPAEDGFLRSVRNAQPGGVMIDASRRRDDEEVPTPRTIYERLDRYVIGQAEAKRAVAIAAYNHLKRVQARRQRRGSLIRKS